MRKLSPLRRGRATGAGLESLEPRLESEPIDRLGEVVVGAERQGRRRFGFHADDDHRDAATRIALLDVREELLAAAVRKSHIEDHAERTLAPERLFRLGDAANNLRAQVARSGLDVPWRARVHRDGGVNSELTLAVSSDYFRMFETQGFFPDPESATNDGQFVYLHTVYTSSIGRSSPLLAFFFRA